MNAFLLLYLSMTSILILLSSLEIILFLYFFYRKIFFLVQLSFSFTRNNPDNLSKHKVMKSYLLLIKKRSINAC